MKTVKEMSIGEAGYVSDHVFAFQNISNVLIALVIIDSALVETTSKGIYYIRVVMRDGYVELSDADEIMSESVVYVHNPVWSAILVGAAK